MALLSQMIRTAAITGRPDQVRAWFADRQSGPWVERMVRDAFPPPGRPRRDPEATRRALEELRARELITDDELDRLRRRLER